jgi:flagellar M-ring protein FliF
VADNEARQRIVSLARSLPLAHRVVIGVAAAVLLLTGFFFFRWLSAPSYAVVASGLTGSEIAEVTNVLDSDGITYELEDGGTRVMVPRDSLAEARSALGREGVTGTDSSKTGQSELNPTALGVSPDIQDLQIRQALETDLERTLEKMDFISAADIALVVPQQSLFEEQQQPVTATVLLTTVGLVSREQIASVVLGISKSVEGLTTDEITVNDSTGALLHAPSLDGSAFGPAASGSMERQVETGLEAKIRAILQQTGAGIEAGVIVNATIDFDETTVESVTYDQDSQVAIREEISLEQFNGADGDASAGVPGVDGGEIEVDAEGAFTYQNKRTVSEYGVNEVRTLTAKAKGDIEKLAIAITIDDGSVSGNAVPTTDAIKALVIAGLGVDTARGDTIAVEAFPFPELDESETAGVAVFGGPASSLDIFSLIGQAIGAVVLILVIVALFLLSRRPAEEEEDEPEEIALEIEPSARKMPQLSQEEVDAKQAREEVLEMVQKQPEEIAVLLRGWLSDR